MAQYIIMKASRIPTAIFANQRGAYRGIACKTVGILRGLVYNSFGAAVYDAYLLDKVNPVGFRVWVIGGSIPLGSTRETYYHGIRDRYLPDKSDSQGE